MSRTSKFSLAISFLIFLGAISAGIYVPALPELSKVFNVLSLHIKLSITLYFMGALFGSILVGPLFIRFGQGWLIFFFLSLFIGASLQCAFSSSIYSFLSGRFFQGVGIVGVPIISISATADRYKGFLYRHMISLIIVLTAIGTGVSHFIGVAILKIFANWQAIFYFLAFMGSVAMWLCYYTKVEKHKKPKKVDSPYLAHRIVNRHAVFKYYQLMVGALEGTLYAFIVISPYIFRMHHGWSMIEFSMIGLILAAAMSIAFFLDEKLYPRISGRVLLLMGMWALGLSFSVLLIMGRDLPAYGLVLIMVFFAMGSHFISGNVILKAIRIEPAFPTIASSLIIFSKTLACALALLFVLVFPEDVRTVTFFVFVSVVLCGIGYFKIRKIFLPRTQRQRARHL